MTILIKRIKPNSLKTVLSSIKSFIIWSLANPSPLEEQLTFYHESLQQYYQKILDVYRKFQKQRGANMLVSNEFAQLVLDARKYLENVLKSPEVIEYFLRVYLSNREVFKQGCEGFLCVGEFVTEVMILLDDGASKKEFREQDFFPAFGMFMGCLGGFAFLSGENILDKDLLSYSDAVAENIYRALKYDN